MKLIYQEDPREWRKSVLLTALGLAVVSALLFWRRHLTTHAWLGVLIILGVVSAGALVQPRWFRGWYRFSLWAGFYSSLFVGRCVLVLLFFFVVTPLGIVLRCFGKDPLLLRRPPKADTYWLPARVSNPLDRLF